MKGLDMDANGWEDLAQDRPRWKQELACRLRRGEKKLRLASEEQERGTRTATKLHL